LIPFSVIIALGVAGMGALEKPAGPSVVKGATVTFTENVAPIVYQNCVTCHRAGEAAPFPLITYDDVKKHAKTIVKVTASRYMPPWHATHGYGEFADERRLTDEQIATIAEWFDHGMPEGDPSKMPVLPKFADGWHLGTPDLIVKMPVGFELPASGPDVYRNFVVPTNLTEDKWVRAVEFRPSARKAVHHVLFAYDASHTLALRDGRDGRPGFGGMGSAGLSPRSLGDVGPLGGWAVGSTPALLPEGVALPLPKGSDLILQMHFHLTGKPEVEQATVGIYFADKAPERRLWSIQVPALFGFGSGIDIPAGEKNFTIDDSFVLPVDMKAFFVGAHAHYLAREMKATATLPDGSQQPILWIQDWDFNWQDRYFYKSPVMLPKGTRIDVHISYDNSEDNPHNPHPSPAMRVQWGEQSFDEMGSVVIAAQALRAEDEPLLQRALAERMRAAIGRAAANGTLQRVIQEREKLQGRGGGR
jgi:mono/diheme cytochrome c family protein